MHNESPPVFRAPHRLFFLLGMFNLLLALGSWLFWMLWPRALPAPAGWLHGWFMMFGVFGPLMSGFLFTAYSRWMGATPPSQVTWTSSFALQVMGLMGLVLGGGGPGLFTALGVATLLAGWCVLLGHLLRVLRTGQGGLLHPLCMVLAVTMAVLTLLLMLSWAITGDALWAVFSLILGQWGFLLGVYLVVGHRMVPFFAGCKLEPYTPYRPAWALIVGLILVGLHVALQSLGQPGWLWLADLPLGLIALWLAIRWQAWRAWPHRLLSALFLSWIALVIGLLLSAAQSFYLWSSGEWLGGRGPAHFINVGFFGAMALAMVTRVTLGHSGRPLQMGTFAWVCLWGVLISAVLRLLAEGFADQQSWLALSALAWLIPAAAWTWRFAPMLWRARHDGASG